MVLRPSSLMVASIALVLAACGDDTSSSTGGGAEGGGGAGEGGGPPACSGACFAIPAGFQGPIELKDSGVAQCTNPEIEGGYADGTFEAPDAVCGCACAGANVICHADATLYEDASCSGASTELAADPPGCAEPPSGTWLSVSIATSATGSCESDGAAATRPSVVFDPPVDGCGVNLDLCEGGDICFPETVLTYCVYSLTESECPAGFEDERRVIQAVDLDDTRDCSCSCGAGTITCSSDVTLSEDSMCISDLAAAGAGGCVSASGGQPIEGLEVADEFVADCGAATESPSGSVSVGGNGVLVCCRP